MKKRVLIFFLALVLVFSLSGCFSLNIPVSYALHEDVSNIEAITVYTYSWDNKEPCGELIGTIAPSDFERFVSDLSNVPFAKEYLIMLIPAAVDPYFGFGDYIVKVTYRDGAYELISECGNQKFYDASGEYVAGYRYTCEDIEWEGFLRKYVPIPLYEPTD